MIKKLSLLTIVLSTVFLIACSNKSDTEKQLDKAGDEIKDAAESAGDSIKEGAEKTKDFLKEHETPEDGKQVESSNPAKN